MSAPKSPTPRLRGTLSPNADGVALVLHGGTDSGRSGNSWFKAAVLRMIPFARAVRRKSGGRICVVRLRNAYYGWSKDFSEPIADAQWALTQIRAAAPGLPIAIVGHSGGGRVALRLGSEPDVCAVVGLAPWVVSGDPLKFADKTAILLAHGTDDRITDPRMTEELAYQLRSGGADVELDLRADTHALLRQARHWHSTCGDFVARALPTAEGTDR